MNTRNWILIHHTGSEVTMQTLPDGRRVGKPQFDAVDRYHKGKGWGAIGYHYFIEWDGTVKKGREEHLAGAHTTQWLMNYRSIGICLAGNFDVADPTPRQMVALRDLLTDIQLRNGIRDGKIKLHREFAKYKSCPGTRFTRDLLDPIIFTRRMRDRIQTEPRTDLNPA